jgi:osmotically inducible lipoprotein OsmB
MPSRIWRTPMGIAIILIASVGLSSCGTTPCDRGLSGGLLGAGTGAAIGALAGSAGEGALIGGLGGAAIGLLTSPSTVNLGEPPWHRVASTNNRRHTSRVARNEGKCTTRETATERVTTCAKAK